MVTRIAGAALRATLVALLVSIPSLVLPDISADTTQIVVLLSLLAGLMTFIEYYSQYPSIIEFRYASPFNRLRFAGAFAAVTLLSFICADKTGGSTVATLLSDLGTAWGNALDFPFSPVRLAVLMLPESASAELVGSVRTAAGISYMTALIALFIFVSMVRLLGWPTRNRAFNVWINLPLFDPTAGGDVVQRLKRDAGLNIVLGTLLPFLIPAVVKATSSFIDPMSLESPQTLIWTMTAWAFLPTSMIMRGIAMGRIAELIEEKRNRAYSQNEKAALQTA